MRKSVKTLATIFFVCCLAFAMNMTVFAADNGECIIWFDEEVLDATVNGIPIENGTWIRFADYYWDEYEVVFTEKANANGDKLEGIYVTTDRSFFAYENTDSKKSMDFSFETTDSNLIIEAVTWDDLFGETAIIYDQSRGGISMDGTPIASYEQFANEYNVIREITFDYPDGNDIPYLIATHYPSGLLYREYSPTNSTYRYSANHNEQYYLRVYWTQEEYEYAKMEYDTTKETYIEFGVIGNGEIDVPSQNGKLRSKSYENYQMIIISNTMKQMKVNLLPEEGEDVKAIYFDGEPATGYTLKDNVLTLNKEQLETVACVEIEFTENSKKFEPNYIIGNGSTQGCPEKDEIIHIGSIFKGNKLEKDEYVSLYFYDSDVSYEADRYYTKETLNVDKKLILSEQNGNYNSAYGWKVVDVSTKINQDGTKEIRIDCVAAVPATLVETINTSVRWRKLIDVEVGGKLPQVNESVVSVSGKGIQGQQQGVLLLKATQEHVDAGFITAEDLTNAQKLGNGYLEIDKYSEDYCLCEEDVLGYSFSANASQYYTFAYANGTNIGDHVLVADEKSTVITAVSDGNTYPGTNAQICLKLGTVSEIVEKVEEAKIILLGDVNNDGTVDTSDAQQIFNHFMGSSVITDSFDLMSADVNEDGVIDTSDAQLAFNLFMGN